MKVRDIKTIDVTAWEYFDKPNANSYFRAQVVINYARPNQVIINLRSQYGYGDQYEHEAYTQIKIFLNCFRSKDPDVQTFWRAYQKYRIKYTHRKYESLHREVMTKAYNVTGIEDS